jgi:hypothetical protein
VTPEQIGALVIGVVIIFAAVTVYRALKAHDR